ncbi:MAG: hypothetical protein QW795_08290 [Candidatus Bathyarchaeia archaeon]
MRSANAAVIVVAAKKAVSAAKKAVSVQMAMKTEGFSYRGEVSSSPQFKSQV